MDELSNSGVTVIFVTHNPYSVERLCEQAIYLNDGRVTATGAPADILNAYFEKSMDRSTLIGDKNVIAADLREGTGAFRVERISLHDIVNGAEINSIATGDSVDMRIALRVNEPIASYRFSLRIVDPAGTVVSYVDVPSSMRRSLALTHDCSLACRIENINISARPVLGRCRSARSGGSDD